MCDRYRILQEALTIFMDITLAIKLGCKFVNTKPMMVKVPGGKKVLCNHMLKGFEWKMRNITFSADVYLMSLRGSDMVLGIQWFSTPGIMQFDFLNHTMSLRGSDMVLGILMGSNEDQIRNIREGQKSKVLQQITWEMSIDSVYVAEIEREEKPRLPDADSY
ncbi:uncharacterized protein Tco_0846631 [Tanacetum coccineum]